jgi:hypothetical protein
MTILITVTYRPIARQRLGKHIPAGANAYNIRTSIARQRISKDASLTIEAVFCVVLAKWLQRSFKQHRELVVVRNSFQMKKSSFESVVVKK